MFADCYSLTSLDLSNFDTRNVKNMRYMFSDNSNLVTIYASEKFTTNVVETGSDMFDNSPKLVG